MTTIDRKPTRVEMHMTKAILLTLISGALVVFTGCGGKAAEKETPKVQPASVASNSNTSNYVPITTRNDRDSDDVKPSNPAISNSSKANRTAKPSDRDDSRSANRSTGSNRPNDRRDADGDDDDR